MLSIKYMYIYISATSYMRVLPWLFSQGRLEIRAGKILCRFERRESVVWTWMVRKAVFRWKHYRKKVWYAFSKQTTNAKRVSTSFLYTTPEREFGKKQINKSERSWDDIKILVKSRILYLVICYRLFPFDHKSPDPANIIWRMRDHKKATVSLLQKRSGIWQQFFSFQGMRWSQMLRS